MKKIKKLIPVLNLNFEVGFSLWFWCNVTFCRIARSLMTLAEALTRTLQLYLSVFYQLWQFRVEKISHYQYLSKYIKFSSTKFLNLYTYHLNSTGINSCDSASELILNNSFSTFYVLVIFKNSSMDL